MSGGNLDDLISVREAQERILAVFTPRPAVTVPLAEAYGKVLAQDVAATQDMPPFDNSSMDGFAVHCADLSAASREHPVSLPVAQDIPAGTGDVAPLRPGTAARIMTGAPVPPGADAVIPLEDVDLSRYSEGFVLISRPPRTGDYIRTRGQDLPKGTFILQAGKKLTPQDVGLLASFGYAQISVISPPRVAIFSSGNELLEPGSQLQPGQIYDANRFVLSGLLREAGAEVVDLGIARDDPRDVLAHFQAALDHQPDLIVSSAGVSVGAFDYVREVIEQHGRIAFWRVNIRPGKPVAFGNFETVPFLGLPGNPVSAYVGSLIFLLPVIRKLRGEPPLRHRLETATLAEDVESDGRESYLRARVEEIDSGLFVSLSGHQGSANLFALSKASALLILPSGVKSLPAGSKVNIWRLDRISS